MNTALLAGMSLDQGICIDDGELIAVLDNLVKGAAGQAVQNLNIVLGLDERTGLL